LPSFYIYTPSTESYNDKDIFEFGFDHIASDDQSPSGWTITTFAARPCDEVIKDYVADPVTQSNMLKEFNGLNFVCPDIDQYSLFLSAW